MIMNPVESIKSVFLNFSNFNGRASRSEYWWWVAFNAFLEIVFIILFGESGHVFLLILLVPSIAVTVRRLHDKNLSGWWAVLSVVPILGLFLLAPLTSRGTEGENNYGSCPLF
jgi:uncharacterized membrane protein YhaH (DUF805 family)